MGKTYQSTIVNAPVDEVWARIRDFHDFSWAPNVIETCVAVGNQKGDQLGARRTLNNVFRETLRELSELEHTIKYSIDDGPSPVSRDEVSDYIGVLRVTPVTEDNRSFVEWSSSWEAKDDKAVEFCHGIYVALLADLKKTFS